jgi:predicted DNA-binding transcriptional regulator AlpA
MIILQLTPEELSSYIKNSVREVLSETPKNTPDPTPDIGDIQLAVKITGFAKATIYNLVSKNEIPFIKKRGKLFFSKKDLLAWIISGKGKTIADIERATDQTLSKLKQ